MLGLRPQACTDGIARVFEILREQMHIAMGLCGRTKIADLKPDLIFRAD